MMDGMAAAGEAGAAAERLGHRPGLDQLRGVAVLLVMVSHTFRYNPLVQSAGAVGVWLFFVLSGFLITRLLLEERDRGAVDRRGFYLRRARRLLPALPAALAVMLAVNAVLGYSSTAGLAGSVTYTTNLVAIPGDLHAFGHMWSLAIEEQFYIAWPLVVAAVAPRRLGQIAAAGAVVVWLARWGLAPSQRTAYLATWFRADALLAGAAVAVFAVRLPRLSRPLVASAAVLLGIFCTGQMLDPMLGWAGAVVTACCVVAVLAAAQVTRRRKELEHVGRISYGLYLFHGPVSFLLVEWGLSWMWVALSWPVAFVLAEASWRLIELRAQERHRKPAVRRPDREGQGAAGILERLDLHVVGDRRRVHNVGPVDVHADGAAAVQ